MSEDEDLNISNRTWDKIASNVMKEGYREGASDGHEHSFQKGFDRGYSCGFHQAEKMGVVNGIVRTIKALGLTDNVSSLESLVFENAQRGLCVMCPGTSEAQDGALSKQDIAESSERYNNKNVDEILKEQENHFSHSFSRTAEGYKPVIFRFNDVS